MGSLSIAHWIILLVVVVLIFGTKKLGNVGRDLGSAVRGFKEGMGGDEAAPRQPHAPMQDNAEGRRDRR